MKTQEGKFTLSGDGLCIGRDSGDNVSEEYKSPGDFKSGTVLAVAVRVGKQQYLDLEKFEGRVRTSRTQIHGRLCLCRQDIGRSLGTLETSSQCSPREHQRGDKPGSSGHESDHDNVPERPVSM
jgi:hypothetical protein